MSKLLKTWRRLKADIDTKNPHIIQRLKNANQTLQPPKGATLPHKSPSSRIGINVPDGLLQVAELIAQEKGITTNHIISVLVSHCLYEALGDLRQKIPKEDWDNPKNFEDYPF